MTHHLLRPTAQPSALPTRPTTDDALSYVRRYFARHMPESTPPAIIYAAIDSAQSPLAKDVLFILPADSTTGASEYRGRFTIWQEVAAPGVSRLYGEW